MCKDCGCEEEEAPGDASEGLRAVEEFGEGHGHGGRHGHGTGHEHGEDHEHGEGHEHCGRHGHGDGHGHGEGHTCCGGRGRKGVFEESAKAGGATLRRVAVDPVEGRVLDSNARAAEKLRGELHNRGVLMLNITSAPGSGKTALLRATLGALEPGLAAVLAGDLETDRDAARLRGLGAQVLQINTGRGCHLSAKQVGDAVQRLDLEGVTWLFVENVGNMACPAEFDLGESARVALLSLPEGDDKVAKYPALFAAADVVILNKIDLAGVLPFDESRVREDLSLVNTKAPLLRLSALGGQGLDAWIDWLKALRNQALHPSTPSL